MRIVLALFFSLLTIVSDAQTNQYLTDLAALKSILQKTPSYKAQIKGEKLVSYNALYTRLAADTMYISNTYNYFYNLAQLIFPLRDNHLGFYQLPNFNNFKTKESIDSFLTTKEFLSYPACKINIDSLKAELTQKPANSIEGIYHYDKFYSIGLFKSCDKEYLGVILDTDVKWWLKGQIAVHLYEYGPNLYKAIYGHPRFKNFILQGNEKYKHQSLVNSYFYASYSQSIYSKQLNQVDNVDVAKPPAKFELKNITHDVQYLLIQTFQADNITMQESHRFYDSIKNSLKAPYLILDLRNNEGGSGKEARKYFVLLRKFIKKGHLYVLINNGTLSQAEILTLKLKKLKNVITVGETTKGMLTYGSNYGNREKLPGGKFEIYPTDMKGSVKLLQYEDYGIRPDNILNEDSNWINQVVELIRKK